MTQTPGPQPSDLQLVVYENSPGNSAYGRMSAISPAQATGIPINTFRVGASRPAAGTVSGEAFYEATTQRGFVWDGSNWRDVTASAIQRYPNDATLVADTSQGVGTFAVSGSTGNIYTYTTTGWQRIGTQEYATVAALLADSPGDGTLALALDEESSWERVSTGWRCTSIRQMADTAAVLAWTDPGSSHIGDRALAQDKEVIYIRGSAGWRPSSIYTDTEANIRADITWPLPGQEAVSTDTGQIFVFANNQWMEDPIQHYPTEVDLLAATPPVGTVAFADDNGLIYARTNAGWRRANSPTVSVGPHPATPAIGDLNYRAGRGLQLYDGSGWAGMGGISVGTTAPSSPIEGDGWYNPTTRNLSINDGSNWESLYEGTEYQTTFSISTGFQALVNLPSDRPVTRYLTFRGFSYNTNSCKLGLIGKVNNAYIDWADFMQWGNYMEQKWDMTQKYKNSASNMANGNAGYNLHSVLADSGSSTKWDIRIDVGPTAEPLFTAEILTVSGNDVVWAKHMSSIKAGYVGTYSSNRLSAIGVKNMNGNLGIAARGSIFWK